MKKYKFRFVVTYNHLYTIEANSEEEAIDMNDSLMKIRGFYECIDDRALKYWDGESDTHFEGEEDGKEKVDFDKEDQEFFLNHK